MLMRIIGAIGFLLRLVGLFFGVGWLILGIMEVSGMSHDEKVGGPWPIGLGVVALTVTFAFSMRKRRAKKRAAARKPEPSLTQVIREDMAMMRDELMSKFEKVLDEHNVTDPAERAELMRVEWERIQAGTEKAVRERLSKRA